MRKLSIRLVLLALALGLLLAGLASLGGCAGLKAGTYGALTAAIKATDEAAEQLPKACEREQEKAVDRAASEIEARKLVGAIQARCDAAAVAVVAVANVARTARDGVHDFTSAAGTPSDVLKWAQGALDAYKNVAGLLRTLGVNLPALPEVNP